jgi:hypothetical protein
MNLLASSVSRWRIGRKVAAPTSPTAHRLAGFADHVGQDEETLCQFIVGYCERHEGPNHVPVLPTAVKSIRPSCRAFSATLVARSLSEHGSRLIQRCWLPGFAASRRKLPRRHPLTASTSRVYERSYPLALAQLVIEPDRLLGLAHVRDDVPILQLL